MPLQTLFDVLPSNLNYNVTGWLTYDDAKSKPEPATVDSWEPFDDTKLVPKDRMPILPEPNKTVELNVEMDNLGDGANYAFFNKITYKAPKVPTLYSVLSAGDQANNPAIYGQYTHPFVLAKDEVVQIVLNNQDTGRHPFHLHGHHFQVLYRSQEEAGTFEDEGGEQNRTFTQVPMRRDTVVVWPNGNIVLRFKADNPGTCPSAPLPFFPTLLSAPPLLPLSWERCRWVGLGKALAAMGRPRAPCLDAAGS